MTPEEQLDDTRGLEALRICEERPTGLKFRELAQIAARLAREGWTPPEPVDPDVLAFREWAERTYSDSADDIRGGDWDNCGAAIAFEAGAKWATDRGNQRTVSLVEALNLYGDWNNCDADLESVLSAVGEGRL